MLFLKLYKRGSGCSHVLLFWGVRHDEVFEHRGLYFEHRG